MIDETLRNEARSLMQNSGIVIVEMSDLIKYADNAVEQNRMFCANYHEQEMQDYFFNAEKSIATFWDEDTVFKKCFDKLDKTCIVELACGHGRHVPQYLKLASHIILVDILESNIDFCKNRFNDENTIEYYANNGHDLHKIEDSSVTAVFSYDAVVHFELLDIFEYLQEIERILAPGGMALIHHSNNTESYKVSFETGRCGRNYMSKELFAYLCNRAQLEICQQVVIDWEGYAGLDCISLVKRHK